MNTVPVRICPFCLRQLSEDWRCPVCGRKINPAAWPPIRDYPELAPYLSTHLIPTENANGCFRTRPPVQNSASGFLRTALPYELRSGKSCIRIGDSPLVADVLIEGSDGLHAVLLQNASSRRWWVFDCGSACGTFVNGQSERLHELQDGDVISIQGVELSFRGNRLEAADLTKGGLAVSVRDLRFSPRGCKRPILEGISFSIRPGEFVGILGPSGCGKSTLIQCLAGLAGTDSSSLTGEILINGNIRETVEHEFQSLTAYLPQNVNESLHGQLTLAQEVACFRRLHLGQDSNGERETAACLSALNLNGKEQARIGQMSGGEQRRVGIALALMRNPRLFLLDEPGAGLDPATEYALMRHLRGIANQGRTVLCVTHILSNATLFDKVLVFSRGKIAYFGSPANLLETSGAHDLPELYQLLSEGTVRNSSAASDPVDRTVGVLPPSDSRPNLPQVIGAYLKRFSAAFFASATARSGRANVFAWLQSELAVLLLMQPLGLVIGLRIACAYYFRENANGVAIGNVQMLGFCAALSIFWVGINNSARAFVQDRVPGRCLERLNGVPLRGYVLARMIWATLQAVGQTISFTLLLVLAGLIEVDLVESTCVNALSISVLWFFPLLVACLCGTFVGLCVSAIAKREISAVALVPNLAILALLFSNAVVGFDGGGGGYMAIARTIAETFMPCHWPSKLIAVIQTGGALLPVVSEVLVQLVATLSLCSLLIFWFQAANERAWKGR